MNAVRTGLTARFIDPEIQNDPRIPRLEVNRRAVAASPDYRAALFDGDKIVFYADIYLGGEADCFREIRFIGERIVVGCGERVHVIDFNALTLCSLKLDGYFGRLYSLPLDDDRVEFPDGVLACSATRVYFIRPEGEVIWRSETVGVDGVVIHAMKDGVIYGDGEWDPPGGWQPFALEARSGRTR